MGGHGMPFAASKGPLLNLMDARYSASGANVEERIAILQNLRAGWQPGHTMGGTFDTIEHAIDLNNDPADPAAVRAFFIGQSGTSPTVIALRKHLNQHWFGLTTGDDGHPVSRDQDPSNPNTGWWVNWKGDAEGVFREGLIRALEVSMGLRHGETPSAPSFSARPPLPIDFSWVCGPPRFEMAVRWRRVGDGGMVIVTFVTPPANGLDLATDISAVPGTVEAPGQINDKVLTQDVGMLVVGQDVTASGSGADYRVDATGDPQVAALEWDALGITDQNGLGVEWVDDPQGNREHGVPRLPI